MALSITRNTPNMAAAQRFVYYLLERVRELLAGLPAEETIQLPPRDTRNIEKAEKKEREDVERGRELRLQHENADDAVEHADDTTEEPAERR